MHRNSQKSLHAVLATISGFIAVFLQQKWDHKKSQFAKNIPLCSSLSMDCCKQYRSIHDSVHFPHPLPAPLFCWAAGDLELHLQIKRAGNAIGSTTGEMEPESRRNPLEYAQLFPSSTLSSCVITQCPCMGT